MEIENGRVPQRPKNTKELMHLPDDCLLHIAFYLNATDKYCLSRTCKRWEYILETTNLWKIIDGRRAPNTTHKISYCLEKIYNETSWIGLSAESNLFSILPNTFFTDIKYLNLTVLALENQILDFEIKEHGGLIRRLSIKDFPHSLEELSLRRTCIPHATNFLSHSKDSMSKLRVLVLDECQWFVTSMFMPLVKYESLEILSLYKCRLVTDEVAYCGFAALGFSKLKIFDARLTKLGNTVMKVLYKSQSILAIYLQNQDASYKLDYFKRQLALVKGAKTIGNYDVDEFKYDDPLVDEFEEKELLQSSQVLCDYGLLEYKRCIGSLDNDQQLPHSVLYVNPYNECKCGFLKKFDLKYKKRSTNQSGKQSRNMEPSFGDTSSEDDDDDDDDNEDSNMIIRILNNKVATLRRLIRKNREKSKRGIQSENGLLHNENYPLPVETDSDSLSFDLLPHEDLLNDADHVIVMGQLGHYDLSRHRLNRRRRLSDDNNDESPEPKRRRQEENQQQLQPSSSRIVAEDRQQDSPAGSAEDDPQEGPSGINGICFNPPVRLEDGQQSREKNERPPTSRPVIIATVQARNQEQSRHLERILNILLDNVGKINVPIKQLSLRGFSRITDQSLENLENLELNLLDLTYTRVTVDAIQQFLYKNPDCRVVHEAFCVCPTNLHF